MRGPRSCLETAAAAPRPRGIVDDRLVGGMPSGGYGLSRAGCQCRWLPRYAFRGRGGRRRLMTTRPWCERCGADVPAEASALPCQTCWTRAADGKLAPRLVEAA